MKEKHPLYEATSMDGTQKEDQLAIAFRKTLDRIREEPEVGWLLGLGTETFALLTEAYANHTGESVNTVRQYFQPKNPRKPAPCIEPEEPPLPEGLIEHVEWDQRDHDDFTHPLLKLQDALATFGLHIERQRYSPNHYQFTIES